MNTNAEKNHMVDLLFTIALFFVFAASSVAVIVLSANAYRQTQALSNSTDSTRTSLSYVAQKIRQNDTNGGFFAGTLDGGDALVLKQEIEDQVYVTYIYQYQDELKELFVKEGASIAPETGKTILKLSGFTVEPVNDQLYRFTMTDIDGQSCELLIGPKTT